MKNLISKDFARKVRIHGVYDTKLYRYLARVSSYEIEWNADFTDYQYVARFVVQRLPIKSLGTTASLSDWQIVYEEVF